MLQTNQNVSITSSLVDDILYVYDQSRDESVCDVRWVDDQLYGDCWVHFAAQFWFHTHFSVEFMLSAVFNLVSSSNRRLILEKAAQVPVARINVDTSLFLYVVKLCFFKVNFQFHVVTTMCLSSVSCSWTRIPLRRSEKIVFWLKKSQTWLENVPPSRYKYPVVSCWNIILNGGFCLGRHHSHHATNRLLGSNTRNVDVKWHEYKHFTGLFLAVVGGDQTWAERRVNTGAVDSSDGHKNNWKQEEMFELTEPYKLWGTRVCVCF